METNNFVGAVDCPGSSNSTEGNKVFSDSILSAEQEEATAPNVLINPLQVEAGEWH